MCQIKLWVMEKAWIPEKGHQVVLLFKQKPDVGIIFITNRPSKDGKIENVFLFTKFSTTLIMAWHGKRKNITHSVE